MGEKIKRFLENAEEREKKVILIGAVLFIAGLVMKYLIKGCEEASKWVFIAGYVVTAFDIVIEAIVNIKEKKFFEEGALMTVSSIGALALGDMAEAAAVMLFYRVGEAFEELAEEKSRRSIRHLLELKSDSVTVRRGDEWQEDVPANVKVGEIIRVAPGGRVPLDSVVVEGSGTVDTKALTGEAMPRDVAEGDSVLQGYVTGGSTLVIRVEKEDAESAASRMLRLVEEAEEGKAKREKFITRFSEKYTPTVVGIAVLLAIVPPLILGGGWSVWVRRALVCLVISCPCALVISVPLTFFGGIGAASRKGMLVRSGEALEELARADAVVFDKTGTLTEGRFTVAEVKPANGYDKDGVLRAAAIAEGLSDHPIAQAIRAAVGSGVGKTQGAEDHVLPGKGVCVKVGGHEYAAGNAKLLREYGIPVGADGDTRVYVVEDGRYAGSILLTDEPKKGAKEAVDELKQLGFRRIAMLTGDGEKAARRAAEACGIPRVHAELLPADKVRRVQQLGQEGRVIYVGDGINDAPALATADVGVAVGGIGSDAAIESADAVMMRDELKVLTDAVRTARKTVKIVMENIVFSLAVKVGLIVLGATGIAGMWVAVVGDVGVMILAVLNSMRMMKN